MSTPARPDRLDVDRILFAADDSPGAERARSLVMALRVGGAAIRVVRALGPEPSAVGLPESMHEDLVGLALAATSTEIASFTEPLRKTGARIECDALRGRAASGIVNEATRWGADLVVVGSHGRGALASAIVGSVAAEVVDHAPCPVLVARTDRVRRIVLADDGSPDADAAACLVSSGLFDAVVKVVSVAHVVPPLTSGVAIGIRAAALEAHHAAVAAARGAHTQIADRGAFRLRAMAMDATAEVREGEPSEEIVRSADEFGADLIVVGTRGATGLKRLLLGSVARNVLYRAKCSVLIARAAS
jgi:nucleotide-binding universal stress UspA family protein